jgi:hypothetical protein
MSIRTVSGANRTAEVTERIADALIRLEELRPQQVVLFGSTAVGLASDRSDVDLLVFGGKVPAEIDGVDIVWFSAETTFTQAWLGSELANHVARYGIWLLGDDDWSEKCFVSERSIALKIRKIEARVSGLTSCWAAFSERYQQKHIRLIRRDLQRLNLMQNGFAVPPGPTLDANWDSIGGRYQIDSLSERSREFINARLSPRLNLGKDSHP